MSGLVIHDVSFYPRAGATVNGKRRPVAFEPYVVASGVPSMGEDVPYRAVALPGRRGVVTLYFRERDGFAEFFLHDPRDEHGYGGAEFSGVLESGELFKVRGPWSSSCATVNAMGLPSEPLGTVALKSLDEKWMYTSYKATLSVLRRVEAVVSDHWRLVAPVASPLPRSLDMADEQIRVVDGPSPVPRFEPTREFDDCPSCEGRGYNLGDKCGKCAGTGSGPWEGARCFDCNGHSAKVTTCPECGRRFCGSGVAPYPHLLLTREH